MNLHFKRDSYDWGDKFFIYDDNGERVYRVKSSILLWNKKFEICDLNKKVLVTIKNEPKSVVKKKFYISIDGKQVAAITKEISLAPKFIIEGLNWEMRGLMRHEYDMFENGRPVFSIHEEATGWGFHPVLSIADDVDELTALAVAMTISYVTSAEEGKGGTDYR